MDKFYNGRPELNMKVSNKNQNFSLQKKSIKENQYSTFAQWVCQHLQYYKNTIDIKLDADYYTTTAYLYVEDKINYHTVGMRKGWPCVDPGTRARHCLGNSCFLIYYLQVLSTLYISTILFLQNYTLDMWY